MHIITSRARRFRQGQTMRYKEARDVDQVEQPRHRAPATQLLAKGKGRVFSTLALLQHEIGLSVVTAPG